MPYRPAGGRNRLSLFVTSSLSWKESSSLYLPYILKEITIKDMDYDTVVKITNENAKTYTLNLYR